MITQIILVIYFLSVDAKLFAAVTALVLIYTSVLFSINKVKELK